MRSMLVVTAALVAGCSQDVCQKDANLYQSLAAQYSACGIPLGLDGGVTSQELATCDATLAKCSPADESALNAYLDCLGGLPSLQCSWLTDARKGVEDPAFVSYDLAVQACEAKGPSNLGGQGPALTPGCMDMSGTSATGDGGATGGSSPRWAGTFQVDSALSFASLPGNPAQQAVSGSETIVQSGTALTVEGFASPVINGCSLSLVLPTASSSTATLSGAPSCGQFTFTSASAYDFASQIQMTASLRDGSGNVGEVTVYLTVP